MIVASSCAALLYELHHHACMSIQRVMLASHSLVLVAHKAVEEGVFNGKQRSHCLQTGEDLLDVRAVCGGDHADEEKCQPVLDQAGQRHVGTKIAAFPSGVNH